jgi:hypothetical protein
MKDITLMQHKSQPAQAPSINLAMDVKTEKIESAVKNAMDKISHEAATKIKSIGDAMPIVNNVTVNVPDQPAPIVNVASPDVVVNAEMPAPTVVVNNEHPKRAVQTVERNAQDEITKTIITYEK